MKKKILIFVIGLISIFIALFALLALYLEEGIMYESLGFMVPLTAKRETIKLQSGGFFDNEEVKKIYLSKGQTKRIIKKIENNDAWKNGKIDERLVERIEFHTREEIYNQIPDTENIYWIFKNRSHGAQDVHSIDELLNDMYYAVSLGILDVNNNILYYYEYDR